MAKLDRNAAKGAATNTAENAATNVDTGSSEPKRPAPPTPSENTTENQPAASAPADEQPRVDVPLVVVAPNPKRAGSKAFGFYAKYGPVGVKTTHAAVIAAGVRGKDVSWDRDRGHIILHDSAKNFPTELPEGFERIEGEDDTQALRRAQADYLRTVLPDCAEIKKMTPAERSGFVEKQLIAWGWVDAPKEEKAEAKADVAQAEADLAQEQAKVTEPA